MKTQIKLTAIGQDKKNNQLVIDAKFMGDITQLSSLFAGSNMYLLLDDILKAFKGNSEITFICEFTEFNASLEFKGKKSGGNALAIVKILQSFQNVVRNNSNISIDMEEFKGLKAKEIREFHENIVTQPVCVNEAIKHLTSNN